MLYFCNSYLFILQFVYNTSKEVYMVSIENLGERLRSLRTERQLTLDMVVYDMNKKYNIDITKGNLSRWENGKNLPSLRLAVYLCMYFDVSLDYLIGNTDIRTPVDLLLHSNKTRIKKESRNETN